MNYERPKIVDLRRVDVASGQTPGACIDGSKAMDGCIPGTQGAGNFS